MNKKVRNTIPYVDTTGMENDEWLKVREHGLSDNPADPEYIPYTITGSGASSALGVNPWVSDEEYRDKKMGIKPAIEAQFNEESKAAGHVFEPFVAINFLRYMHQNFPGIKVNLIKDVMRDILPYLKDACPDKSSYKEFVNSQNEVIKNFNKKWELNPSFMYRCGVTNADGSLKYPFALANIDGLVNVNGKIGIFEAKTTKANNSAKWDYWEKGKIPPYYYWQLVFYMACLDVDFAYITCCWGFTLDEMAVVLLKRDKQVEEDFMNYLAEFVEDMETGTPLEMSKSNPEIVANYYERLYGEMVDNSGKNIELSPAITANVEKAIALDEELAEAKAEVSRIEAEKKYLVNTLIKEMDGVKYGKLVREDGTVLGVNVSPSYHRDSFDADAFMKDHPELIDQFATIDSKKLKKSPEHAHLLDDYTIKGTVNEKGTPTFKIYEYEEKADNGGILS